MHDLDLLLEPPMEPEYGPMLVDVAVGDPRRARHVIDRADAREIGALTAELLALAEHYCSTGHRPMPRSRLLAELTDAALGDGPLVELSAPVPVASRAAAVTSVLVADPGCDRRAYVDALPRRLASDVAWTAAVAAARALLVHVRQPELAGAGASRY